MKRIGTVFLLCLAGCGSGTDDGVGGVSATEAKALNDAAALLDARTEIAADPRRDLNPAASIAADRERKPVEDKQD